MLLKDVACTTCISPNTLTERLEDVKLVWRVINDWCRCTRYDRSFETETPVNGKILNFHFRWRNRAHLTHTSSDATSVRNFARSTRRHSYGAIHTAPKPQVYREFYLHSVKCPEYTGEFFKYEAPWCKGATENGPLLPLALQMTREIERIRTNAGKQ